MSLSKIKSKVPIAYDLDDKSFVYYHNEKGITHLQSDKGYLPCLHGDTVGYSVARRNSGKTWFCKLCVKTWLKKHKDGRVFMITKHEQDPSIDDVLPERSQKIHPTEIEGFTTSDFHDSLLIIDDTTDSELTPKQQKQLDKFVDDMIDNGRHDNIQCLLTNHLATDYKRTRVILNGCSFVTIFPRAKTRYQLIRLLKTYLNFDKKEIDELLSKDSRWVQISTIDPYYILTEHEVYLY